ncbi:MAG TPA: zf-HC2 domain-containing protein [Casimicrobiaceae bacterium]|nr:zf-HC2 domain-containing protein [Casimicrobiaceae bacterium]
MLHRLTHVVSCREASRLLSRREERPLTGVERIKLALHLRLCSACTRFARQLVFIRRAMVRYRS